VKPFGKIRAFKVSSWKPVTVNEKMDQSTHEEPIPIILIVNMNGESSAISGRQFETPTLVRGSVGGYEIGLQ
jgi:hypothetical protein